MSSGGYARHGAYMGANRDKPGGPQGTVRARRVRAGLTQEQLAEMSGLSVRAISDIERGATVRPRRSSIALLHAALDHAEPDDPEGPEGDAQADLPHAVPRHLPHAVPRQLPRATRGFVGRAGELEALTELLDRPEAGSGTVVISAIAGTPGVGKTALAVHWAHQVAGCFPDGQLFVNLRGYDPDRPVSAADALAGFLRALGVPGQDVPADEDERAALYRSLLAGRRMLVVLDNAGSVEQVRPLLPGAAACAVVVTSRDALAGLVARDGAARLDLGLLPAADSVGLLRALIGARVDADPGTAAVLAERCCRLPLALRVAAELAAARPSAPLAELAAELADQQRRLDLLNAGGDPRTGVRAVFSWSYQNLDAGAARAFRLLGLHPGPDLDSRAAAALIGSRPDEVRHVLRVLGRAHLIEPAGPGRHGMQDLLRGYARELAASLDTEGERRDALTRLFDHYLRAAAAAMDVLYPGERDRRPQVPAVAGQEPPLTESAAARAWLDAERANLVTAAAHAAGHGWPEHATRLAATLFRHLEVTGHVLEMAAIHGDARRAAVRLGDRAAEAEALRVLAIADMRRGRCREADDQLRQAIREFREAGDAVGEARTLADLGTVCCLQGRYRQAVPGYERALALYRQLGDRFDEARALNNLGLASLYVGRYEQAGDYLRQAAALSRQTEDRAIAAYSRVNLGVLDVRLGRYEQAVAHLTDALALSREAGHRSGEAHSLLHLGVADLRQGRAKPAISRFRQALALSRELGDLAVVAEALNGLGEALLAAGRAARALARHQTALVVASRTGDEYQQARAHNCLARCYHVAAEPGPARRHWQRALVLYTALGVPEADEVRAELAAM
jgi:tetratricopeptide (TPR) repeat protein/transcriptional regulator with XRE-family HTH domain